jgi:hypothetical protein
MSYNIAGMVVKVSHLSGMAAFSPVTSGGKLIKQNEYLYVYSTGSYNPEALCYTTAVMVRGRHMILRCKGTNMLEGTLERTGDPAGRAPTVELQLTL